MVTGVRGGRAAAKIGLLGLSGVGGAMILKKRSNNLSEESKLATANPKEANQTTSLSLLQMLSPLAIKNQL
jgi:hypothetical protein